MERSEIVAGTPATEHWITDTCAHVVTRVTAHTVWTRRVAEGEPRTLYMKGPWPVTQAEGLLDQPEGEEMAWTLRENAEGRAYATRGSGGDRISLTFGQAYRRVDYSN